MKDDFDNQYFATRGDDQEMAFSEETLELVADKVLKLIKDSERNNTQYAISVFIQEDHSKTDSYQIGIKDVSMEFFEKEGEEVTNPTNTITFSLDCDFFDVEITSKQELDFETHELQNENDCEHIKFFLIEEMQKMTVYGFAILNNIPNNHGIED